MIGVGVGVGVGDGVGVGVGGHGVGEQGLGEQVGVHVGGGVAVGAGVGVGGNMATTITPRCPPASLSCVKFLIVKETPSLTFIVSVAFLMTRVWN